jgi:hypothetical protein
LRSGIAVLKEISNAKREEILSEKAAIKAKARTLQDAFLEEYASSDTKSFIKRSIEEVNNYDHNKLKDPSAPSIISPSLGNSTFGDILSKRDSLKKENEVLKAIYEVDSLKVANAEMKKKIATLENEEKAKKSFPHNLIERYFFSFRLIAQQSNGTEYSFYGFWLALIIWLTHLAAKVVRRILGRRATVEQPIRPINTRTFRQPIYN